MIKHLGAAMLAVCSLAVGMPAAANHATVNCRFNAVSNETATGDDTWEGLAQGYIVGNAGESVTVRCAVKVNGVVKAATAWGSGTTGATTSDRVTFVRPRTDTVQLCAQHTTAHGAGERCFAIAPGDLVEFSLLGCDDGIDNDLDGYPDRSDPGCVDAWDGDERGTTACDDGQDNDGDGQSDYPNDLGCVGPADDDEFDYACSDGVDNDADGRVDYPADPGCASAFDANERGGACDDGIDNDGDGLSDPADPGCAGPGDASERGPAPCDDGVDNDGDGLADYPADPGCRTVADPNETTIP